MLALLKDRGEVGGGGGSGGGSRDRVEWSGRVGDIRSADRATYSQVYRAGDHASAQDASIEAALTERDEFGRVLTPKERFRRLCHRFHGIEPSKNTKEKRLRKLAEEVAVRKAAGGGAGGSGGPGAEPGALTGSASSRLAAVAAAQASPFIALEGRVTAGQTTDAASLYGQVDRVMGPPPARRPGGWK
jgi:U4/U6.U5 tri-snRNP-associated protein 1